MWNFKKFKVSLIFILATTTLIAQKSHLELNLGSGRTNLKSDDDKSGFVNPIGDELQDFYRLGILYYYTPKEALIKIKTGLTFNQRGNSSINYKYLRIPIGLDLQLGNRVYFIIGGGIINSILLSYEGIESTDFLDSKRDFQLLAEINTGIGVNITNTIDLTLGFQNNFDITKIYEDQRLSPGGASYTEEYKGRDGFLYFAMRYKIKKMIIN